MQFHVFLPTRFDAPCSWRATLRFFSRTHHFTRLSLYMRVSPQIRHFIFVLNTSIAFLRFTMAPRTLSAVFLALFVVSCLQRQGFASARTLSDCVSAATSSASSQSTSAVSTATSDAFAQCTSCPCTTSASTAAEVSAAFATWQILSITTPALYDQLDPVRSNSIT